MFQCICIFQSTSGKQGIDEFLTKCGLPFHLENGFGFTPIWQIRLLQNQAKDKCPWFSMDISDSDLTEAFKKIVLAFKTFGEQTRIKIDAYKQNLINAYNNPQNYQLAPLPTYLEFMLGANDSYNRISTTASIRPGAKLNDLLKIRAQNIFVSS